MFLPILLVSVVFLSIALLGMGLQTFFSSRNQFPDYDIGKNKEMRKKGLVCAKTEQKMIDKGILKVQDLDPMDYSCSTCK